MCPGLHLKAINPACRSEQVSVVSLLLLPLLGMCCPLIPDTVNDALPYLLGGLMAVSGRGGPRVRGCVHASGITFCAFTSINV